MPADASMKVCRKCGEEKRIDLFERHYSTRDSLRPECRSCRIIAQREWRHKNKDKVAANDKRARERNPEKFLARQRSYYKRNQEKVRNRMRIWSAKNKDKVMAKNKKWQEANKEKYLMAIRACNNRKRGRGTITRRMIESLNESQSNMCVVCRIKLGTRYHLDHIMPLARGGDNSYENLQLLCPPCNQQKKDRHPVEFMQSRGLLL